jgi:hypothetical protein
VRVRARITTVAAIALALVATACSHGASRLAPLRDDARHGSTATSAPARAPADGSQAGLRAALRKLIDVEPPAGYELAGPDTDLEPAELGPELTKRFSGLGFERAMERIWETDTGEVHLILYAFGSAVGAQQGAACGCGVAVAGLPAAWEVTAPGAVEVDAAAGSYVVRVVAVSPSGARPVGDLVSIVRSVRAAVGGSGAAAGVAV